MNEEDANIDLIRSEKRLFLPAGSLASCFAALEARGLQKESFDCDVGHTVYFLDGEQSSSVGVSYKARRYLPDFSKSLDLNELRKVPYLCEVKREPDPGTPELRRKCKRIKLQLDEAQARASESAGHPLRPYLVVEYRRAHFTRKDTKNQFRVTLDTGTRFWLFPAGQTTGVLIGDAAAEGVVRAEIKFDPRFAEAQGVSSVIEDFRVRGSIPAISKKGEGLNFIKWRLDRLCATGTITAELQGKEVEAKLSVEGFNFDSLCLSLRQFAKNGLAPFFPNSFFPHLGSATTVNHYWGKGAPGKQVEGLKVMGRGGRARATVKAGSTILDARLGVLERDEVKGKVFPYEWAHIRKIVEEREREIGGPLTYVGHLLRIRKIFWLRSPQGRVYHFSIERCVADGRPPLDQIEIEYVGLSHEGSRLPDRLSPREEMLLDLGYLAAKIINFIGQSGEGRLSAVGVEKFKWLSEGHTSR